MMNREPITVSQLNAYIKASFDQDINLKNLYVCGEISNFKKHFPSGHFYFSLKDKSSVLRVVMFAGQAIRIPFDLKDGMNVVIFGRVSCYEASGQYQLYANNIQPEGIGSVYLAFEQLKSKLSSEGLFDDFHKKPLPRFPVALGVVTSETGAVIHDIKTVMKKRYPLCEIILYPTEVQGEKAEFEIVRGIEYFNKKSSVDIIIVGRGGGSIEDLWAFNKESVARAVFNSKIPIISAVGHETDFTICDFVADVRAATPSQAAEIAVPDADSLKIMIVDYEKRFADLLQYKFDQCEKNFDSAYSDLKLCGVYQKIEMKLLQLDNLKDRLKKSFEDKFRSFLTKYEFLSKRLELCSEKSILKRGFVRLVSPKDKPINCCNVSENERIKIKFSDGDLECNLVNIVKNIGDE